MMGDITRTSPRRSCAALPPPPAKTWIGPIASRWKRWTATSGFRRGGDRYDRAASWAPLSRRDVVARNPRFRPVALAHAREVARDHLGGAFRIAGGDALE